MVEKVIKRIVLVLDRNLPLTQDQREVTEYALYNVFITGTTLLGALIVGSLVGVLPEVAAALLTGAVFRWSTGGAHLSRPDRCIIVSIFVPLCVALMSKWISVSHVFRSGQLIPALTCFLFVLSCLTIWRYAPAQTENKPISPAERPKLRVWAYVTLAAWVILMTSLYATGNLSSIIASCFGLTWQMLSVTPAGYRIFSRIDVAFEALGNSLGKGGLG